MSHAHAAYRSSLVQMHVAVLLAGGTGLFAKLVTVDPMVMVCVRTLCGSLTLLLIAGVLQTSLQPGGGRSLGVLALCGAILAFHWYAFFHSIRISTVAMGVLGLCSFPLFVTFFEPVFFRERLRRSDVAMGLLVVAGLMLVTPAFDLGDQLTQGLLWGILSGLAYAVFSLVTRSAVRTLPAITVAFYQQIFAGLASLPLVWTTLGAATGRDWTLLVVLGVIFTGMAQWLMTSSLRHLSVQTYSVLLGLEPVYAIVLAWFILGEIPQGRTVLGGMVICGTVLWASLRPARTARPG